jgi:F-type H+-transporting ATPase subunit b
MLIDWFTVGAQALNFLILVWLMKRFLYQPILHAIDAREKRIAARNSPTPTAKEGRSQKGARRVPAQERGVRPAARRSLDQGDRRGERRTSAPLDEARQAADALSAKRQETLLNDARNLSKTISRRTQDEVFAIARKALTDLAGASLEERIGESSSTVCGRCPARQRQLSPRRSRRPPSRRYGAQRF